MISIPDVGHKYTFCGRQFTIRLIFCTDLANYLHLLSKVIIFMEWVRAFRVNLKKLNNETIKHFKSDDRIL